MISEADAATLVRAAKRGDRLAFSRLHDAYARTVHAMLLARVPVREADDLVQEVFLQAWRSLKQLRDAAAFPGWLARIARNKAADFHRKNRFLDALPDEIPGDPTRAAEAKEALVAIRQLPEAYRETLLMRLVEGMSGPEIAARTGMTHGSVRVNLHRGMKLLRERLGIGEAEE